MSFWKSLRRSINWFPVSVKTTAMVIAAVSPTAPKTSLATPACESPSADIQKGQRLSLLV